MKNLSDELTGLKNNLEKINRQINKFARKRDIREMERMMDLLNPMRQEFVEPEQRKIIRQSL